MPEEEPRYTLSVVTDRDNLHVEREISTAQVQFWPEIVRSAIEDLEERASHSLPTSVIRVDLVTNDYHSEHVRRLDTESHGPLLTKALEVLR